MSAGFVDRRHVARRFSRVAPSYGDGDFLVREIDRRMQERLDYVSLQPKRIIDLGCSRGGSFAGLSARYPEAELIGLDISPAMLAAGRQSRPGWQRWQCEWLKQIRQHEGNNKDHNGQGRFACKPSTRNALNGLQAKRP